MSPSYLKLHKEGKLTQLIAYFSSRYYECDICPQQCKVNRYVSFDGKCHTRNYSTIASASLHFGEEKPLVGTQGSGAIFFTGCNMKCVYCQNCDISQLNYGSDVSAEELAELMLYLQNNGAHNINFVSPTHMVLQILQALTIAIDKGLHLPLVYNTGGYDSVDTVKMLEGIFDIYMPDIKYSNNQAAKEYSKIGTYVPNIFNLIREMHRQVGDLVMDSNNVAQRGLIIRHLVLPGHSDDAKNIIDFVANLSKNTYFNLMDQYRPMHMAHKYEILNRSLSFSEFEQLAKYASSKGLIRLNV